MTNQISIIKQVIVRLRKKQKPSWKQSLSKANAVQHIATSNVAIDSWGGTSVNPSEVFRTSRGRADLEALAALATKLRLGRTAAAQELSLQENS